MAVEIKQTDSLSETEYLHLFHWAEDVFETNGFNLSWRMKSTHFLLYEDQKLVGHVGVLKHTVSVAEDPVTVGGVGGVVTRPEAQKKGYAKELVRRAADFLAGEWRVEAGLLFCLPRMIPFYRSFGWQKVEEAVLIEQPGGRIESPLRVMIRSHPPNAWRAGEINLNSWPW